MCGFCDIVNKDEKPLNLFSELEIQAYIEKVWHGIVNVRNLDLETYLKVARKLSEGVFEGYKKTLFDVQYGSPDYTMLTSLRENVYVFSGAKEYQNVREMSGLLTNEGGVNSYKEFKDKARGVFDTNYEKYLQAEYNSAISQSRSASQWQTIENEKDVLPFLIYKTAGDGRVRPSHADLNNISRPVDDKFWDNYMPPNGWNCRCDVIQTHETIKTNLQGFKQPNDVPDIFMMNSGKDRIVFSPKHPYFDVAPKDKNFAKGNFDLPLPHK